MEKTKFSFAMVIAILAILLGAYIALMGLVYWLEGAVAESLAIIGITTIVAILSLWCVCRAKANRFKRQRKLGYYIFAPLLIISVIAISFPLGHFVDIAFSSSSLQNDFYAAKKAAENIPSTYETYKTQRIENYRSHLNDIKADTTSSHYADFQNLPGRTDNERIDNAVNLLNSLLEVNSNAQRETEQKAWLENASKFTVWSFSTTQNIRVINNEVSKWVEEYAKQSEKTLKGENSETFKLIEFNEAITRIDSQLSSFSTPSVASIITIILFFGLVILPYILTSTSIVSATSQRTENYE